MKTMNISFKIITIISLLFVQFFTNGQSLSPFVVANAGSSGNNGNISLDWTVGEPCIATLSSGNTILTQGFHQPALTQTQIIDLITGWSGISSYLAPVNVSALSIFNQLSDNLVIAKNYSGFYWPSQNINTLGLWYEKEAFEIKVNESSILHVTGKPLKEHSILLNQGWNYLPVLRNCPVPVEDFVAGNQSVEIIKGVATSGVFWPQFGINSIINLEPGKGYFIKCTAEQTLTFPDCSGSKFVEITPELFNPENSPWPVVKSSPISHLIVFQDGVMDDLNAEDIIGVFANGQCVGVNQLSVQDFDAKKAFSVTAYADDPTTAETDGFAEGDAIRLKIFSTVTGKESSMETTWDSGLPNFDGLFAQNGLSAVKSLAINSAGSTQSFAGIKVFPNPTTGVFRISGVEELLKTTLLNSNGMHLKSYRKTLADGSIEIDITDLPTGIYWVTVETREFTKTEKVVKY
jgi:hypothetical protein